jgi:hypothetical protein
MTMNEFVDITDDIAKFYGKDINSFERNVWFEELGKIDKKQYEQIARECMRTEKYMPKLADILRIKQNFKFKSDEWKPVECQYCKGEGLIIYHKKDEYNGLEIAYACRCTCENGKRLGKSIPLATEINIVK